MEHFTGRRQKESRLRHKEADGAVTAHSGLSSFSTGWTRCATQFFPCWFSTGSFKELVPRFLARMSQAECLCEAEKRMKVPGSQIAKLKSFHGPTKEVANTGWQTGSASDMIRLIYLTSPLEVK
jgi:hypothetical protein